MRYYYFNPLSKQYYFPEGFHNYPLFSTFYKPYKLSAKFIWKIWWNSALIRRISSTNKVEKVIPIELIIKYVSQGSILAFNIGTKGIDQKISVLSIDANSNYSFFIKYATSKIACQNVFNEGIVLEQISQLPFVPKLKLCVQEDKIFTLIKTTVLLGEKTKQLPINDQLLNILYTLSEQKVKSNINYDSDLICCFAHGDFCPWNMLIDNGKINIFDWELAGKYPLGYDLFTYIFQYNFLVNEMKRFNRILKDNAGVIHQYFNHYKVNDWIPYLKEFATLKHGLELEKNNSDLIEPYFHMKQEMMTAKYLKKCRMSSPQLLKKRETEFKKDQE